MAGTNGWELPTIETHRGEEERVKGLTALPAYPQTLPAREHSLSSIRPSAVSEATNQHQTRHSLGNITVQQDFSLAYERSPRDSMSPESMRRSLQHE